MFDRTYRPGGSFAPVAMGDGVGEREQVFRTAYGWVDRPVTLCGWHQAVVAGLASDFEAGRLDGAGIDVGTTIDDVTASFARSCQDCA